MILIFTILIMIITICTTCILFILFTVILSLRAAHQAKEIPAPAGQVMAVTWLYVSVVLMAGVYSSQLTASLTVREEAPPFSSLQELVTQDIYTWGVSSGTALQTMIRVKT